LSFFGVDFVPILDCSLDVLGNFMSKASKVEHIRPEQSNPAFEVPERYRVLYFLKPAESIDPENRD
jgi:hypothetical protein